MEKLKSEGLLDRYKKSNQKGRGGPVELPGHKGKKRKFITVYCEHMLRGRFHKGAPEVDCERMCQFAFPDQEPFKTHFREQMIKFMIANCPHRDKVKVAFVQIK